MDLSNNAVKTDAVKNNNASQSPVNHGFQQYFLPLQNSEMIWGSEKSNLPNVDRKQSTGTKSIFKVKKPAEISSQLIQQITNVETVLPSNNINGGQGNTKEEPKFKVFPTASQAFTEQQPRDNLSSPQSFLKNRSIAYKSLGANQQRSSVQDKKEVESTYQNRVQESPHMYLDSQRKQTSPFQHPKVLNKKFPVLNLSQIQVSKPAIVQKGGAPAVDIEQLKNIRRLKHIENVSEQDRNSSIQGIISKAQTIQQQRSQSQIQPSHGATSSGFDDYIIEKSVAGDDVTTHDFEKHRSRATNSKDNSQDRMQSQTPPRAYKLVQYQPKYMQLLNINKPKSPVKKPETPPSDPRELEDDKRKFEEQILMLNQTIKRLAANTHDNNSPPAVSNTYGKKVILDRPVPSSQSETFSLKKNSEEVQKPQVFKLTEVEQEQNSNNSPIQLDQSLDSYDKLDISSFKSRYNITRIKENMLQNQLEDRVRENESKVTAKFEKRHSKLMQIIIKQQLQMRQMMEKLEQSQKSNVSLKETEDKPQTEAQIESRTQLVKSTSKSSLKKSVVKEQKPLSINQERQALQLDEISALNQDSAGVNLEEQSVIVPARRFQTRVEAKAPLVIPTQSPANSGESITPALVMLPESYPGGGPFNSTHRTTNRDLMSNNNPSMTRASLQRQVQKDIIQLKDAIKTHLATIVDQGVSLQDALFKVQDELNQDNFVTDEIQPLVIEKQVRIDLAHRGSNLNGETKQVKFRCQVQLEEVDEQQPDTKHTPIKKSPSEKSTSHQKTLSHPNKIISLNKVMHMRNDSAPMLEAPETFLQHLQQQASFNNEDSSKKTSRFHSNVNQHQSEESQFEEEIEKLRKEKIRVARMQEIETIKQEIEVEKDKLIRQKKMNASQRSRMHTQHENAHTGEDARVQLKQYQHLDSNYDPAEDLNISRMSERLGSRMSGQRAKVDYTWRINARNNLRQNDEHLNNPQIVGVSRNNNNNNFNTIQANRRSSNLYRSHQNQENLRLPKIGAINHSQDLRSYNQSRNNSSRTLGTYMPQARQILSQSQQRLPQIYQRQSTNPYQIYDTAYQTPLRHNIPQRMYGNSNFLNRQQQPIPINQMHPQQPYFREQQQNVSPHHYSIQAQFNNPTIHNNYSMEEQDLYNSMTFQQNSLADNNDNNVFDHNPNSQAEFATAEDYLRGGPPQKNNNNNESFNDSRDQIFSQDDQEQEDIMDEQKNHQMMIGFNQQQQSQIDIQDESQPLIGDSDIEYLSDILKKNEQQEIKKVTRELEIRESANLQLLQVATTDKEKSDLEERQRVLKVRADEKIQQIKRVYEMKHSELHDQASANPFQSQH